MTEKLQEIAARYDALTERLAAPDAYKLGDYAKLARERAELEEIVKGYRAYVAAEAEMQACFREAENEGDPAMRELLFAEAYALKERLSARKRELEILLLPKDKNDGRGCTLEIRAGAGGEEAALFAYELYRMYMGYCEKHRFSWEVADRSETELGGIKEAVVLIGSAGAYKRLKFESGVHRVQRVPETESQGRIHTSTCTVAVLPEAEDIEAEIRDEDIRIDLFRSSGAGGQKVNKTETAIRITHFPTGIVVTCQDERSQLKNKEKAFRVLQSRLYDYYSSRAQGEEAANRKSLVGTGDRSERIRTYNFPQSRITDHRIGLSVHNMESFLAGDLDEMIDALARADTEKKLTGGD